MIGALVAVICELSAVDSGPDEACRLKVSFAVPDAV